MFLKTDQVKRGDKIYKYYKIVEAYRDEDGKPKHKVIQNLGALSDENAAKIRMILSIKDSSNAILAKSSDIMVKRHWLFLPVIVLHSIWRMFNLDTLFSVPLLVEAMVINRCIDPRSKIQITDWTNQTVLPALCESVASPDEYAVYRTLDSINDQEAAIQSHLYKQLEKIDTSLGEGFFYDITSTYMEGSQCVIAKFGYSRDHRPDLQQIVIALMVTPQGSPFYWKVLEGNAQDVTTLPDVVKDLKERFGLKSCHLVFDRDMVSEEHLAHLEARETTYLSAMDKDEIAGNPFFNEFLPQPVTIEAYDQMLPGFGFMPTDDSLNFYTREGIVGKRRYIFSFDAIRFKADEKNWDKRVVQITEWLSERNKNLLAAKKSRKRDPLERDVNEMIKKRRFKNILQPTITPIEVTVEGKNGKSRTVRSFQVKLSTDKVNEAKAKRLHGITCFITNVAELEHAQAIQKYREKNKIEEAFREMKSALALRPIYLSRTARVKAHVTICVLAYLLMNTIELILKRESNHLSSNKVIQQLKGCQLNEVGFHNSSDYSIVMTQLSEQQKEIVKLLKCEEYLQPKALKPVTDFLKTCL